MDINNSQDSQPANAIKGGKALLIALFSGGILGLILHPYQENSVLSFISSQVLGPLGQVFLRLIFMVVVPLVFSALVLGVFELSKGKGLGRIALKTLTLTLITSSISVLLGIALVNIFKPGASVRLSPAEFSSVTSGSAKSLEVMKKNVSAAKPFTQSIVELIPKNPLDSAVRALDGEMISWMVFALIFGVAMGFVFREKSKTGEKSEPHESEVLPKVLDQVFQTSMQIIQFAMELAPYAVFGIIFNTSLKLGFGLFKSLFSYVLIVVCGLLLQQVLVYSGLLATVAKRSPWQFFKDCREVLLYAFSTASSNATLPVSLRVAETKLKLSPRVSRFVLTIGATANQNGTALFEGITVLFLAQVFQIHLSFSQQLQVVTMSILAGIGTAGVPGGSLPLIMILLNSVGIPMEGIALILGVDRFLDMCRTTLNVSGDLVIAACVDATHAEKD